MSDENRPPRDSGICVYDHFDPETFEPLNEQTRARVREIGFTNEIFGGRTVLDIGCNSGYLSIQALQAGASHVFAYDVQPHLVDIARGHATAKDLAMTVGQKSLDQLDPRTDAADVVLFFEVLHWAVAQGATVADAIAKVAALTGETLFIETPWDINEPSIQAQTELTEDDYNAAIILDELTRHFDSVEFVRFMSYFDDSSGSRRPLIVARRAPLRSEGLQPHVLTEAIPSLTRAPTQLSVSRDSQKYFADTSDGPRLIKQPAGESRFWSLEPAVLERVTGALRRSVPTVVAPEPIDGSLTVEADGVEFMLFPWIGERPSGSRPVRRPRPALADHLALAIQVTAEMASIDEAIVDDLRAAGLLLFPDVDEFTAALADTVDHHGLDDEASASWVELAASLDASDATQLAHGDFNTSNLVVAGDGTTRVVDLDNLGLATAYADVLWVLAFMGADGSEYRDAVNSLRSALPDLDQPSRADVVVPLSIVVIWLSATREIGAANERVAAQRERVAGGLRTLLDFAAGL